MPLDEQRQQMPAPSEFIVFDDFSGGMNTQSARQGLDPKFASWMENLQPVASNNLLGVQGPVAALATLTGETIVKVYPGLIGTQDYLIAFCASGAGYTVTVAGAVGQAATGGTITLFAPAGTFMPTGGDLTTLNAQRFLIADTQAGYCTWDGSVFVQPGGVSPNFAVTNIGSGYTNGATAAITGGSGTGATANVVTSGGTVTGLTLTNAGTGYLAGDTLTVTISPVSGGSGATANGHVWPFISPRPSTIAVAFGRVFMAVGRTLITTGTGSATFGSGYDDMGATSVTTTLSDVDLIHQITALRFLENYLYIVGDNSVKSIGGISISGSTTSFTITTLSSDQGTTFQNTVLSYNRLIIFANVVGVFAVFGASVEKISDEMDGIFRGIDATQTLVAAVNDVNNIHTYMLLVKYNDPITGKRSIMLSYAGKRWYLISQGTGVTFICTSVLAGHADTFATSGSDLTQIIQDTANPLAWKLSSAMTAKGNPIRDKRIQRVGVAQTVNAISDLSLTIDTENGIAPVTLTKQFAVMIIQNNSLKTLTFTNSLGQTLSFTAVGFVASHTAGSNATGRWIGFTANGTLNGISLQGFFLEYQPGAMWGRG